MYLFEACNNYTLMFLHITCSKYWHYLHSEPPHVTLLCSLLVIQINRCSSCKNSKKIHAALCYGLLSTVSKKLLVRSSLYGCLYCFIRHLTDMKSIAIECGVTLSSAVWSRVAWIHLTSSFVSVRDTKMIKHNLKIEWKDIRFDNYAFIGLLYMWLWCKVFSEPYKVSH